MDFTVPSPDLPEDYTDVSITGMAAARNDIGRWSNTTEFFFPVGRVNITWKDQSGQDGLEGSVEVHGEFQSIGNATIQWRLDNEDWQDGPDYHDGEWTEEDLNGLCHSTSQFKGDGSSDLATKDMHSAYTCSGRARIPTLA